MKSKKPLVIILLIPISLFIIFFTALYMQKLTIHNNIDLLKSENEDIRKWAGDKLVKIGEPAVDPLLFVIRFDTHQIQSGIVGAAGYVLGNNNIRQKAGIINREGILQRAEAARVLGDIGDKRAIEPVANLIKLNNLTVNKSVAYSLKKFGSDSVPPLLKLLDDKNLSTRCISAWILGEIGDDSAVVPLAKMLQTDKVEAKDAALRALVKTGRPSVKYLTALLKDNDPAVRHRAAEGLGEIGDSDAFKALAISTKDENLYVRLESVKALGKIGYVGGIIPVIMGTRDKNESVRIYSEDAFNRICDKGEEGELIRQLFSKSSLERLYAIQKIVENDDSYLDDLLVLKLEDDDEKILNIAIQTLEIQKNIKSVAPLFRLAGNTYSNSIREASIKTCSRIIEAEKQKQAYNTGEASKEELDNLLNLFIKSLSDENEVAQINAAILLGELRDKRAVEPLMERTGRGRYKLRTALISALGKIGDNRAVDPLITAAGTRNKKVKMSAALALGSIGKPGDKRIIDTLLILLRNKNSEAGNVAFKSLLRIGDKSCAKDLVLMVDNGNPDIRHRAIELLGFLGDEAAIPSLIRKSGEKNEDDIIYVIQAMGNLKHPDFVRPLAKIARVDEMNSITAITELEKFRTKESTDELLKLIKDRDFRNYHYVIKTILYSPGNNTGVDILVNLLGDEELETGRREKIILELSSQSENEEYYRKFLEHRNPLVRKGVQRILKNIDDWRPKPII